MFTVFLDRDGTIGGDGTGLHPHEFRMYPEAPEAIKRLNDKGVQVFLFTNQGGISEGRFTEEELHEGFEALQKELAKIGAKLDGFYYCPHQTSDDCNCKKPRTGMLEQAQKDHHLDFSRCYVVGDKGERDILAAHTAGVKNVLVKTGWGEKSLTTRRHLWADIDATYTAEHISDAVSWILQDIIRQNN